MSRIEYTVARYGKWNNARNVRSCYCTGRRERTGRLKWNYRKEICHRDPLMVKFVIINQTGHLYQQSIVLLRQINHPKRTLESRTCVQFFLNLFATADFDTYSVVFSTRYTFAFLRIFALFTYADVKNAFGKCLKRKGSL